MLPNVIINFSKVRVKVQGQHRRTENLPLQQLGHDLSRYFHHIWQSGISNFGMEYDFLLNLRWQPGGGLHSVSGFSS